MVVNGDGAYADFDFRCRDSYGIQIAMEVVDPCSSFCWGVVLDLDSHCLLSIGLLPLLRVARMRMSDGDWSWLSEGWAGQRSVSAMNGNELEGLLVLVLGLPRRKIDDRDVVVNYAGQLKLEMW